LRSRSWVCVVALGVLGALAGCGDSGTSHTASAPHCKKAPAGIGPDATATLQDQDAGGTYCLPLHGVLTVYLHAPVTEERWSDITATPSDGALAPRSTGVLTLPRGVTAAIYEARRRGTVALQSTRPPCSASSGSGCDASHSWSARVVVP
jgi:hypothetical protein